MAEITIPAYWQTIAPEPQSVNLHKINMHQALSSEASSRYDAIIGQRIILGAIVLERLPGLTAPISASDLVRSLNIPPRPALLMALQREMRNEDPHIKKVAQLINRDVAMAGELLQAANSTFFSLRRRVDTVEDAITMIGVNDPSLKAGA